MLFDLGDGVEEHAYHDQDRGAAEGRLEAKALGDEERDQGDAGQKEGAGEGHPGQHAVDVVGGGLAGLRDRYFPVTAGGSGLEETV